uniref:Uncharacterized protein n=1 Tax=Vitrella brassicaformis TaxID=1169539 RepID=A0A7S1KKH1_9ALVE|mmetsp:Transcript_5134/g.14112  ORF Transcript_5134/g.14112 Transcript_5134/m.14112 type:complete len:128 (-) Transcript_5134:465-848(-)
MKATHFSKRRVTDTQGNESPSPIWKTHRQCTAYSLVKRDRQAPTGYRMDMNDTAPSLNHPSSAVVSVCCCLAMKANARYVSDTSRKGLHHKTSRHTSESIDEGDRLASPNHSFISASIHPSAHAIKA